MFYKSIMVIYYTVFKKMKLQFNKIYIYIYIYIYISRTYDQNKSLDVKYYIILNSIDVNR